MKKVGAGTPLLEKKNISEKKFTESEQYKDAESFKINRQLGESTFINLLLHFIFAYLITGPILHDLCEPYCEPYCGPSDDRTLLLIKLVRVTELIMTACQDSKQRAHYADYSQSSESEQRQDWPSS